MEVQVEERNEMLTEEEESALKSPEEPTEKVTTTTPEEKVETETVAPADTEKEAESQIQPEVVLAKDGKNVIPFSVLEKERAEVKSLKAEIEALKAKQITELSPKAVQEPQTPLDAESLAKKLYESEEGAAEVINMIRNEAYNTGVSAGRTSAFNLAFETKVEQIKNENPWLTPDLEEIALVLAKRKMTEPGFNPNDLNSLVKMANESVSDLKKLIKMDALVVDEAKIREDERKKTTEELMAKLNITPPKTTTLTGVRNVGTETGNKLDHVDSLSGIDYEDALLQLTPAEKEALLLRSK